MTKCPVLNCVRRLKSKGLGPHLAMHYRRGLKPLVQRFPRYPEVMRFPRLKPTTDDCS